MTDLKLYYAVSIDSRPNNNVFISKPHLVDSPDINQRKEAFNKIFEEFLASLNLSIKKISDLLAGVDYPCLGEEVFGSLRWYGVDDAKMISVTEINKDVPNLRLDDLLTIYSMGNLNPEEYLIIGNYLYYRNLLLCSENRDKYMEDFTNRTNFLDITYDLNLSRIDTYTVNPIPKVDTNKYNIGNVDYRFEDFWNQFKDKFITGDLKDFQILLNTYRSYFDFPEDGWGSEYIYCELKEVPVSEEESQDIYRKYLEIMGNSIKEFRDNFSCNM